MVRVETGRKKQPCWPRRPISLHPMNRTVGVGGGREGGGTTHRAGARKEKNASGTNGFPTLTSFSPFLWIAFPKFDSFFEGD